MGGLDPPIHLLEACCNKAGQGMGFTDAVKSVFRNYSKFSGRALRSEYWYFTLFVALCDFASRTLDGVLGTYPSYANGVQPAHSGFLQMIFVLIILVPHIAVAVRRLHDTDHSGWWYGAAIFVPVLASLLMFAAYALGVIALLGAAGLFLLILFWLCSAGTPGPNRFGLQPAVIPLSSAP